MQNINIDKLLFKYEAALKIIKTKFDIIYNELNQNDKYNYIEYIKSRIKSEQSIYNKLSKNGYEITEDNIENHIHDIAGIRIVCSFLSDIEKIEELIKKDEDITIIKRKDYISNPKNNGYSSLHLIVKVPVPLLAKAEDVEVEIQIRTIAMDMWASLEHKLFYKAPKYNQISKTNLINDFSVETRRIDNLMEKMIKKSEEHSNIINDNYYDKKIEIIKKSNMLKYQLAEKVLKEKAENLNYELSNTKNVNPIEHIKTRIKKPLNIVRKLERLNYDITEENMNNHIHDLVGILVLRYNSPVRS